MLVKVETKRMHQLTVVCKQGKTHELFEVVFGVFAAFAKVKVLDSLRTYGKMGVLMYWIDERSARAQAIGRGFR